MDGSALYVYGVVDNEVFELDVQGVGDADRVYTVESPPLSAVVSDAPSVEPEESEANLRAHNEVLQELLHYDGGRTVVPMQFGMAFRDRETLENLLGEANSAFTRALDEVDGKVELGLKILAPPEGTVDAAEIREEAAGRFDDIAAAAERGDQFSDRLVLNRSYLVDRENQEAFNEAVGEFEAEHDELLVQYTGPWPPYNFVDIHIGAKQR